MRSFAKQQADAQLSMLMESPFMAAATAGQSAVYLRQARRLNAEQREALLKLRGLCQSFVSMGKGPQQPSQQQQHTQQQQQHSNSQQQQVYDTSTPPRAFSLGSGALSQSIDVEI